MTSPGRRCAALAGATLLVAAAQVAAASPAVERHLAALAATLDPRAARALDTIRGTDRQLLAARAYLRSSAHLGERWSWSEDEIARWAGSEAQRRFDAAVARVRCSFEAENPGYTLYVNPTTRSLETQIAHWNANESVGLAAARLLEIAERDVAAAGFPAAGSDAGLAAFHRLLVEHVPEPTPTLAAPGLSLHGRMQAVDFHVERDGRTVAGPDARSVAEVWRDGGWERKLAAAVTRADAGFVGPLRRPDEPWHYDLVEPAARDGARLAADAPPPGGSTPCAVGG